MCSSKCKPQKGTPKIVQINGRPVLQPKSNQVPSLERRNSIKKITSPKSPTLPPLPLPLPTSATSNYNVKTSTKSSIMSPPISPKLKSPRPPAVKRGNEAIVQEQVEASFLVEAPAGSIAAARREQVAIMQEERKMKIAHYGRTKSSKKYSSIATASIGREKKRCSFITPNSGMYKVKHKLQKVLISGLVIFYANLQFSSLFVCRSYICCLPWWRMGSACPWWQVNSQTLLLTIK